MPSEPQQASNLRKQVSGVSQPILAWLTRRPRWMLAVATCALVVAGLAAPTPYGPICLAIVALLLLWLAYLSWPVGSNTQRGIRVVMVLLAFGAFVVRLLPGAG